MNLRNIARLLGGEVSGRQVVAPGPGHSEHDRSMAVFIDDTNPDGFRVHSFSGDDWKTCRDYVKSRLGIADGPFRPTPDPRPADPKPVQDDVSRTAFALSVWKQARSIAGTPVQTYLGSRGIDTLPDRRKGLAMPCGGIPRALGRVFSTVA